MTISSQLDEARRAEPRSSPSVGRAALAWAGARWLGLSYAALLALTLAPLLLWPVPPTFDLVNHWARLTLYHMAPGDPLAALYQVRLTPIPDLALDLANLALSPLLSPQSVATLGWAAAILLPAWGAWRVGKAVNGVAQPAILFVPALSYNLVVTLGLVNFAIGMGLALLAYAAWLAIDRRRVWLRLTLFNAISVALFFCHLAAFASLVLLVALYEMAPLTKGETSRDWAKRNLDRARAFPCRRGAVADCGADRWPRRRSGLETRGARRADVQPNRRDRACWRRWRWSSRCRSRR